MMTRDPTFRKMNKRKKRRTKGGLGKSKYARKLKRDSKMNDLKNWGAKNRDKILD